MTTTVHELVQRQPRRSEGLNVARVCRIGGKQAEREAFTKAQSTACHSVPIDDFVWFLTINTCYRGIGRMSSGTNIHCAFCLIRNKAKEMSCVLSVQYGDSLDSCLVLWAFL